MWMLFVSYSLQSSDSFILASCDITEYDLKGILEAAKDEPVASY
jgi:hypothetical protein